ncbi:hypothetical protein [Hymenobacter roseosalivarius]|uniref:hypothetical protein n=1 Tax=Hymenobacter roseosalivarius TaxID=89967 RepID=UPI0013563574|nr:hypothetical protein [Hymenobacter roseosalivarius]
MKKLLIVAVVGLAGLGSCRTKCPAYATTKPATQVSSSITASAEQTSAARQ